MQGHVTPKHVVGKLLQDTAYRRSVYYTVVELSFDKRAMPKPPRQLLVVDLGDLKASVVACASKNGKAAGPWVREVLCEAVKAAGADTSPQQPSTRPAPHRRDDADRVNFGMRLPRADSDALMGLAMAEGVSQAEVIVRLIRSAEAGTTGGMQSLQTLAESNRQLLALGRNLNQIAKSLNANPGLMTTMTKADRACILAAVHEVRSHLNVSSGVIKDLAVTRRTAAQRGKGSRGALPSTTSRNGG